jgi:predicted TIM-barrel fold metal-dependent hydrolase
MARVIDGDGHVLEPHAAWAGLVAGVRPEIFTDRRGLDHVVIAGTTVFVAKLGQMGQPGTDVGEGAGPVPLEAARAGAFEPRARLADMDAEGIDEVVLYPTIGLGFWGIPEARAAAAVCRAYNDWLADFCAVAPDRLHGAALIPFQDVNAATAELRRCRDDFGFVAAMIRPNPCRGRTIGDPANEPFWDTAEQLGVAVAIHEGYQPAVPPLASDRLPTNVLIMHAVSHTFEQMLACAAMIGLGVLERHPRLRVVFLEAGGGWAPYWLGRLDHQVASYGRYAPDLKLTPSEYFARQCWVSFELDELALPALAPLVGPDRIVWGSDYPHADSTFPGAVAELQSTIAPLSPAMRARILGANAADLYGLTSPIGRSRLSSDLDRTTP